MTHDFDIDNLAERITRGDLGRLSHAELDAVLSWISGSERLGAAELIHRVGVPRERPDVMRQVYTRLDVMLFIDGRLDRLRAGVQAGVDDKIRRARFRRLMAAFHPDRHPDSADWLTPRSQAVLEAYRNFRAGREDGEPPRPPGSHATGQPRRARGKTGADRSWPVERNSARLTPEHVGLMTRMRLRLRSIDNLQGKVLAALAVAALVPVIWVYFSHKPYRDHLAPSPTPADIADVESAEESGPATLLEPQPDSPARPSPESHPLVASAEDLPGEIELRPGREDEGATELDRRVDKTTPAFGQLLAMNRSEPQTTTPDSTEPPGEPTRNPEPGTRNPTQEPQAKPHPERSEPPREPARSPETGTRKPSESPKPQAPATSESTEPNREPTREPESTPQAPEPSESTEPPREPTRNPETGTRNPTQEPQAPTPSTPTTRPIEARIQHLLDTYSLQFSAGNLDGIMTLLASDPRENRNLGRGWFRDSYRQLFEESATRRIDIEVTGVEQRTSDWRVTARFELQVNYPSRDPVHAEQTAQYTVVRDHDGNLRIQSIDY